ncbi:hypothetical protein Sarmat_00051 [Rickettsiales endosymbiont of Paramecium tredecaurelia]|uniref:hypothetical protein n=1 Tax=Candidatus Sarmatiella mevalonica TaxID=2770581 RepID=UPI0019218190|nr:hypothetical protein [Candidatus Sarmatiella mevalonica]MBL3284215.1 hypothetical protein [Candidatus Sarmatiella mevalonica]
MSQFTGVQGNIRLASGSEQSMNVNDQQAKVDIENLRNAYRAHLTNVRSIFHGVDSLQAQKYSGSSHHFLSVEEMEEMHKTFNEQSIRGALNDFQKVQKIIFAAAGDDKGKGKISWQEDSTNNFNNQQQGVKIIQRKLGGDGVDNSLVETKYNYDSSISITSTSGSKYQLQGYRTVDFTKYTAKDVTVSLVLYDTSGGSMIPIEGNNALHFSVTFDSNGKIASVVTPTPLQFDPKTGIGFFEVNNKCYTVPVNKTQYEALTARVREYDLARSQERVQQNISVPQQDTLTVQKDIPGASINTPGANINNNIPSNQTQQPIRPWPQEPQQTITTPEVNNNLSNTASNTTNTKQTNNQTSSTPNDNFLSNQGLQQQTPRVSEIVNPSQYVITHTNNSIPVPNNSNVQPDTVIPAINNNSSNTTNTKQTNNQTPSTAGQDDVKVDNAGQGASNNPQVLPVSSSDRFDEPYRESAPYNSSLYTESDRDNANNSRYDDNDTKSYITETTNPDDIDDLITETDIYDKDYQYLSLKAMEERQVSQGIITKIKEMFALLYQRIKLLFLKQTDQVKSLAFKEVTHLNDQIGNAISTIHTIKNNAEKSLDSIQNKAEQLVQTGERKIQYATEQVRQGQLKIEKQIQSKTQSAIDNIQEGIDNAVNSINSNAEQFVQKVDENISNTINNTMQGLNHKIDQNINTEKFVGGSMHEYARNNQHEIMKKVNEMQNDKNGVRHNKDTLKSTQVNQDVVALVQNVQKQVQLSKSPKKSHSIHVQDQLTQSDRRETPIAQNSDHTKQDSRNIRNQRDTQQLQSQVAGSAIAGRHKSGKRWKVDEAGVGEGNGGAKWTNVDKSAHTVQHLNNRPLSKLVHDEQMRGVYEAQSRSVHEVRGDLRIGATKRLPSEVELGKRSNEQKAQQIKSIVDLTKKTKTSGQKTDERKISESVERDKSQSRPNVKEMAARIESKTESDRKRQQANTGSKTWREDNNGRREGNGGLGWIKR